MRHFFRRVHLWLSIPLAIIIAIICISGTILVFQDNIEEWSEPHKYFNQEKDAEPLPIGKLIKIVNSKLDDNSVKSVEIPSDQKRNYIMGLENGARASVYVNPYTGDVTGKSERGNGFFSVVLRLHRWLLGERGSIGQSIVGYTTLFFVIILITGLIIWWPKTRKQLKKQLQIKTKYGLKRFWFDLHISGGAYLFIGLLVLSLTGLYFSFDWYRKGLSSILGIEMVDYHTQKGQAGEGKPNKNSGDESSKGSNHGGRGRNPNYENTNTLNESGGPEEGGSRRGDGNPKYRKNHSDNKPDYKQEESQKSDSIQGNSPIVRQNIFSSWQIVFDSLKEKNPNYKSISLQDGNASVSQNFTFGNVRATDKYNFDNESGEITKTQLYKDQDGITKLRGWIYSLHTGKWGGVFSKILTCIVSLAGATLPFTGYYMFIVRRKKKRNSKKLHS